MIQENNNLYNYFTSQFPSTAKELLHNAIHECIIHKKTSYYRFLITKIDFQEIKHRKIVQKIYSNYIPQ